jgi:acetyl-CoA hydrolase
MGWAACAFAPFEAWGEFADFAALAGFGASAERGDFAATCRGRRVVAGGFAGFVTPFMRILGGAIMSGPKPQRTCVNAAVAPALDWGRLVRPGDRLACSHMTAEPAALLHSLGDWLAAQAAGDRPPLAVFLGVPFSEAATSLPANVEVTTFGGIGAASKLARSRALRYSLSHYGQCEDAFTSGALQCDVALVSLARSATGRLTLGASHGFILAAARSARLVVAEINGMAPAMAGAPWPDDIPIHAAAEVSYPLPIAPELRAGPAEDQIASHIASIVRDGACLQVGIGALPAAVLARLKDHRFLGLHSGMLTPALWTLMRSGAMDNSRKPIDTGIAIAGCAYGDAALYSAVHDDPSVQLREPGYTHAQRVIASLDDLVAINSGLEVDLLGQVNAEAVPAADGRWRYIGGVGGLADFMRGAKLARRGTGIVALPARQPDGRPRIVARLAGPATVSAADADVLVTEHGVARLRDVPLDERVRRIVAVADPADREGLAQAARAMGLAA